MAIQKIKFPAKLLRLLGGKIINLNTIIADISEEGDSSGVNFYATSGTLTSNRVITGGGFSLGATGLTTFSVSGSGDNNTTTTGTADIIETSARGIFMDAASVVQVTGNGISLTDDAGSEVTIESTGIGITIGAGAQAAVITDSSTTTTGLTYAADYSADFSARSLVDKGYVDARFTSGSSTQTTDGAGLMTITHGFGSAPTSVVVSPLGSTPYVLNVTTIGATTFTVLVSDTAAAAVATTSVSVNWFAR